MGFKFIIIFAIFTAVLIYSLINWKNNGSFFGFSPYKNVDLAQLLSFANFYNGKNICTTGFYVASDHSSIIKVSLSDDEYTRSAWINNASGKNFFDENTVGQTRSVEAKVCGKFESRRGGEFGNPSVWNHQITVEEFETFGE